MLNSLFSTVCVVVLLTIPTMWGHAIGRPVLGCFKSRLLRFVSAWFFGQFALTWCSLLGATALTGVLSDPLKYASLASLIAMTGHLYALSLRTRQFKFSLGEWSSAPSRDVLFDAVLMVICLLFAWMLYRPHLSMEGSNLIRSTLYWDFAAQFSLIQSFAEGDNFPPTCELQSGTPLVYHYFYFLFVAIYSANGLGLVNGLLLTSSVSFAAVLICVAALAQEFVGERRVALIVVLLAVTTSSLNFVDFIVQGWGDPVFWQRITKLFTSQTSPYAVAFLGSRMFGYNGNFFNLYLFVEERQLLAGCLLLLLAVPILAYHNRLSNRALCITGCLFGLAVQWHLFSVILIGFAVVTLLFFSSPRRGLILFTIGLTLISGLQLAALSAELPSSLKLVFSSVPRFNFTFASNLRNVPNTPWDFLAFWIFVLGLKVLLAPVGFFLLYQKNRAAAWTMGIFVAWAFLLTNTVQLSPLSVYENHKWARPIMIVVDLFTAIGVAHCIRRRGRVVGAVILFFILVPLTASGFIEGVGLFRSFPRIKYADFNAGLVTQVQEKTEPTSRFVSEHPIDILLTGRRLYTVNNRLLRGNPRMEQNFTTFGDRTDRQLMIFESTNQESLCRAVRDQPIDYIEYRVERVRSRDLPAEVVPCLWPVVSSSSGDDVQIAPIACVCGDFKETGSPG